MEIQQRPVDSDSSESEEQEIMQDDESEQITPETLRSDVRAMERAARRIARFNDDDSDDSEEATTSRRRSSGKKSGSLLVAAAKVKKAIDWPHMHVSRLVAGERVGVVYKELRIEEFVYGFLEMLDAPKAKWDRKVMMGILKMLMQGRHGFFVGQCTQFLRPTRVLMWRAGRRNGTTWRWYGTCG